MATVDENGVVTGVSSGIAYIIFKCSGLTSSTEVRIGEPETEDGLTFYKISEDEYAVGASSNGISRSDGRLVIPSAHNGKAVTKILAEGFYYCYNITSVFIPSSINEVGTNAFGSCYSLKEVKFESAVPPKMGDNVFSGTWDYSDFKILVPNSALPAYKAITAEYWQSYAIDNIFGYNPDGE